MPDKPKKADTVSDGDNITVGDISNASGIAVGRGAKASVTQYNTNDIEAITTAFSKLHAALIQVPDSPKKKLAEHAVKGLETEAQKGAQADEETVEGWFTSLMAMLPDIGEVAINTFINPINGLSTVFQKIAKKAKKARETR